MAAREQLTLPKRPSGEDAAQPVRKNGMRGTIEMGVGHFSKGAGSNPTRGHPPAGMFGQLMGREDLAAHSKFKKKGGGKRGSKRGTKKAGY